MCEAKKKNRQKQQFRKKKVNDLVRRVNFGSLLIRSLFPTNTGRHVVQKGVKVKKKHLYGKRGGSIWISASKNGAAGDMRLRELLRQGLTEDKKGG